MKTDVRGITTCWQYMGFHVYGAGPCFDTKEQATLYRNTLDYNQKTWHPQDGPRLLSPPAGWVNPLNEESMPDGFKWEDVDHTIELPHIYDGWSIAVLKDGTKVNRWAGQRGYERRAKQVQDVLDQEVNDASSPVD